MSYLGVVYKRLSSIKPDILTTLHITPPTTDPKGKEMP